MVLIFISLLKFLKFFNLIRWNNFFFSSDKNGLICKMTDSSKNMRKGSIPFFKLKYPLSRTVKCLLPYHQNAKDF